MAGLPQAQQNLLHAVQHMSQEEVNASPQREQIESLRRDMGPAIYVGTAKHSYHNVEFIREMKTTPTGRVRVYVLETVTCEDLFAGPSESRRTVVPGDSVSTRLMRRADDGGLVWGSDSEKHFELWDGKPVTECCYY